MTGELDVSVNRAVQKNFHLRDRRSEAPIGSPAEQKPEAARNEPSCGEVERALERRKLLSDSRRDERPEADTDDEGKSETAGSEDQGSSSSRRAITLRAV